MFEESPELYFDVDELADLCTVGGVDVVAVFTNEGDVVDGIEITRPLLVAWAADVPAVAQGTPVVAPKVGGTSYRVRYKQPDETGRVIRLYLEEV